MLRLRLPLPRFVSAGEIFVGRGSLAALKSLEAARATVIVSPSILANAELAGRIEKSIGAVDIRLVAAPRGEPSLESLQPVAAALAAQRPDWIVAIGGGSVLDAAKLAWVFYEQPEAEVERIARPFALPKLRGKARFVAVPTTAGTGSEVSSAAVFTDATTGRKRPIVSHDLLPDVAVLDPTLTVGVPPAAIAAAGLDALAHAVESYVSNFANPLADALAEKATEMILAALPRTFRDPNDLDARLEMMEAALLAGWVQNQKVPGIGHAVAHQLGRFHVPHGLACGALLVPSIEVNQSEEKARAGYRRLAQKIGLADERALVASIDELRATLDADDRLRTVIDGGLDRVAPERAVIREGALEDICCRANPRRVDAALIDEVLQRAL